MTSKKVASEVAVGIILLIAIVAGGVFWMQSRNSVISNQSLAINEQKPVEKEPAEKKGVMCTQDAKLCAGGSYVARTGPNCEFAECPQSDNYKNDKILADLCKNGGSVFKCGKYFKEDPPRGTLEMPWLVYDSNFKLVQTCGGGAPASPDLEVEPMPEVCRVKCESVDLCLR